MKEAIFPIKEVIDNSIGDLGDAHSVEIWHHIFVVRGFRILTTDIRQLIWCLAYNVGI